MTNSVLVSYTCISPNKTSPRNHEIDTITIHCTAGESTLEGIGSHFSKPATQASANYAIDKNGKIGLYVNERDRSWASSNRENDNRAITIELVTESKPPYRCSDATAKACVGLLVDICKRNGIKKLLWEANRSLIGDIDHQNITLHRWFSNTACPGEYIISILPNIVKEVNSRLIPSSPPSVENTYVQVQCEGPVQAGKVAQALRLLGYNAEL